VKLAQSTSLLLADELEEFAVKVANAATNEDEVRSVMAEACSSPQA
jgi:hypothetical protein